MSNNIRIIIKKGTTIEQIYSTLLNSYPDAYIDSGWICFTDGTDKRFLSISFDSTVYNIDGVYCSLSDYGNAYKILRSLCEVFGGYLSENEDGGEFIPINFEEFSKGKEFTDMDLFRHEVITKLGYDKLEDAIKLFKKFKKLYEKRQLKTNL